jgi:hypothetical protein
VQGGSFNNVTGEFVAPVSGSYLFLFHSRSEGQHIADTALMVAGKATCLTYIYTQFQTGTCHSVSHMREGERAWVEPYYTGHYGADTTSFTGLLIRKH